MPAPAMAQPWMAFNPTPPQPKMTAIEPASTLAVLTAAPTPVITPQAINAARSSGMLWSILTTLSMCTVAYSAMTPQPQNTLRSLPAESRVRTVPSGSVNNAFNDCTQSCGRPVWQ